MTLPSPANREPVRLATLVDLWSSIIGPELAAVVALEGFDRRGDVWVSVERRDEPAAQSAIGLQILERLPVSIDGVTVRGIKFVRRYVPSTADENAPRSSRR